MTTTHLRLRKKMRSKERSSRRLRNRVHRQVGRLLDLLEEGQPLTAPQQVLLDSWQASGQLPVFVLARRR